MARNVRCGLIQVRCEWSPEKLSLGEIKEKMIAKHERLITDARSEEHTSELQSHLNLVCRLLLEKKNNRLYNPDGSLVVPSTRMNKAMCCSPCTVFTEIHAVCVQPIVAHRHKLVTSRVGYYRTRI